MENCNLFVEMFYKNKRMKTKTVEGTCNAHFGKTFKLGNGEEEMLRLVVYSEADDGD